jgi:hypothetical protein
VPLAEPVECRLDGLEHALLDDQIIGVAEIAARELVPQRSKAPLLEQPFDFLDSVFHHWREPALAIGVRVDQPPDLFADFISLIPLVTGPLAVATRPL